VEFCGIFVELLVALCPPTCYAVDMGRIIRRTVIITITETCTITWATGDDPLSHPPTVVQDELTLKEEPEGALQNSITDVDAGKPSGRKPPATPHTTATANSAPDRASRKRTRTRRTKKNPQSK